MFDSDIERTIIGTAIALWFGHGWYLNSKLERVHEKLDRILNALSLEQRRSSE